jgi:hypothetical protein
MAHEAQPAESGPASFSPKTLRQMALECLTLHPRVLGGSYCAPSCCVEPRLAKAQGAGSGQATTAQTPAGARCSGAPRRAAAAGGRVAFRAGQCHRGAAANGRGHGGVGRCVPPPVATCCTRHAREAPPGSGRRQATRQATRLTAHSHPPTHPPPSWRSESPHINCLPWYTWHLWHLVYRSHFGDPARQGRAPELQPLPGERPYDYVPPVGYEAVAEGAQPQPPPPPARARHCLPACHCLPASSSGAAARRRSGAPHARQPAAWTPPPAPSRPPPPAPCHSGPCLTTTHAALPPPHTHLPPPPLMKATGGWSWRCASASGRSSCSAPRSG